MMMMISMESQKMWWGMKVVNKRWPTRLLLFTDIGDFYEFFNGGG